MFSIHNLLAYLCRLSCEVVPRLVSKFHSLVSVRQATRCSVGDVQRVGVSPMSLCSRCSGRLSVLAWRPTRANSVVCLRTGS